MWPRDASVIIVCYWPPHCDRFRAFLSQNYLRQISIWGEAPTSSKKKSKKKTCLRYSNFKSWCNKTTFIFFWLVEVSTYHWDLSQTIFGQKSPKTAIVLNSKRALKVRASDGQSTASIGYRRLWRLWRPCGSYYLYYYYYQKCMVRRESSMSHHKMIKISKKWIGLLEKHQQYRYQNS